MKNNYVTITDIAARAGVTTATVSMCLSNNPRISQPTRDRVQALAREMGYRVNPYVSALMRTRRRRTLPGYEPVVALVSMFDTPDGWRNIDAATIRQMREGAIERATDRGYRAQDFWLYQDGMSNERFSQMLHARGIQGILLGPIEEHRTVPVLDWKNFASVSLSTPFRDLTLTTVCNDHHLSAFNAVKEVNRLGYHRPGLAILESQRKRLLGRWDSGFVTAQHLITGIEPTQALYVPDWKDHDLVLRWIKREKLDVVITSSGLPMQRILDEAKIKIPDDIGLVTLGCRELGHPISGVYQNGKMVGAAAMDALIGMIERNERGLPDQATAIMIEGKWNPGQTLRAQVQA